MIRLDMRSRYLLLFGLLTFAFLLPPTGCGSGPKPTTENVPVWLTSIPDDDRYFYAVGVSGQTRNIKDAWDQASQRARAELGRTIITHVTSKDLIIATNRGEYSRQVIDTLSDTELNFAEVIKRWYDRFGSYGPAKYYYVLVRLEKKRAKTILKGIK